MDRLDADTVQSIVAATASGYTMSLLSMTCRLLCGIILGDEAEALLWRDRLMGRSHLAVALRGRPLLRGVHRKYGLAESLTGGKGACREAYRYAYVCCKVTARILRQEYVACGTLLHDICIEADRVAPCRYQKAWLAMERRLLDYPVGSSFDAGLHVKSLVDALPTVLEATQVVNHDTLATLRLIGKRYQRMGRVPFDLVWELRRLERRVRHILRLALFAHAMA